MSENAPIRFFLSYNTADVAWARWVEALLLRAGYGIEVQRWDHMPRATFVRQSHLAASQAALTIALLSPQYRHNELSHAEWVDVFLQDLNGPRRKVLPVCVQPCTLPAALRGLEIVDIATMREPAAATALMRGVVKTGVVPVAASAEPLADGESPPSDEPRDSIDWSGLPADERPTFPGYLSMWRVPLDEPTDVVGRGDLVRQVRRTLNSGQAVALTQGKDDKATRVGAMGKTRLALTYAHRYRDRYSVVWWLRAAHPVTLAEDFAAMAGPILGESPVAAATPQRVAMVKDWLADHPHWLLVFDNAGDDESVTSYLPDSIEGHVLITSRRSDWAGTAVSLPVPPLDDSAAALLFPESSRVTDAAKALLQRLGGAPDLLACVGGVMRIQEMPASAMLAELDARMDNAAMPSLHHAAVDVVLAYLERASVPAADLVKLCAFFDADLLPTWVLEEGEERMPRRMARVIADPVGLARVCRMVSRFGLVTASDDVLSWQRAMQAVVRDVIGDEHRAYWAGRAVDLIASAFPWDPTRPQLWPTCAELLPHAQAALDHATTLGVEPQSCNDLRQRVDTYLRERRAVSGSCE